MAIKVATPAEHRATVGLPDAPGRLLLVDLALGLLAGLVATQVTNMAQWPLRLLTPDAVHRREERVRPGASSSLVAAGKMGRLLSMTNTGRGQALCGTAIHFALGAAWGPVYGLLRRHTALHPAGAAMASGAAMSLILDEWLVPTLGLSAPNRDYPLVTHVRGFVAHLVYGVAVAAAAEGLGRLTGRPFPPRRPS